MIEWLLDIKSKDQKNLWETSGKINNSNAFKSFI